MRPGIHSPLHDAFLVCAVAEPGRRIAKTRSGSILTLKSFIILTIAMICTIATARAASRLPGESCESAIVAAGRLRSVPVQLMSAIGLVEAGRQDPAGVWRPWPWTINAEGKGYFFDSKAEAISAVRDLQAEGVRSIDVGCMQINLMHHPAAFATLDDAFDPSRNAMYAGHFLAELYSRSRNWMVAAGWYHSTTSDLAAEYVKRVTAFLDGARQPLFGSRFSAGPANAAFTAAPAIAAPIIGRDGVIMPSMRLTALGLILPHSSSHYPGRRGPQSLRFGG